MVSIEERFRQDKLCRGICLLEELVKVSNIVHSFLDSFSMMNIVNAQVNIYDVRRLLPDQLSEIMVAQLAGPPFINALKVDVILSES